jgi:transposase
MYDELPDVDEIKDLSTARSLLKQLYTLIKPLQTTNESLQNAIEQLRQTIGHQTEILDQQRAELAELRRMMFGKRSEVMPPLKRELSRGTSDKDKKATQAKRRQRRKQRQRLPSETKKHDVPDPDQHCAHCHGPFRVFGPGEISYEIDFVPARFAVLKHIRQRLICRCGETIVVAPAPPRVSDGVHYGPGFHAQVAVAKCADSMPLYRQARQLQRIGIPVSRSTLGDLFHRSAELLTPLRDAMLTEIAAHPYVNADETPIRRLADAPGTTHRSYIWTFCTDELVAYRYTAGRSGALPEQVLGDSPGVLQVDGYTGYNSVCTPQGRQRAGCWAHTRRYFWKARGTDPEDSDWMLDRIRELYRLEYHAADLGILGTPAHKAMRQHCSAAVVEEILLWVEQERHAVPPKSPLGKAYTYLSGQMDSLTLLLDDPRIDLDNNLSERMLRIVAIGRKNFLFVGNDVAGDHLAVLQSLIATCDLHDVNPTEYLTDVLMRIQSHPANRIGELLPHRWVDMIADTQRGAA